MPKQNRFEGFEDFSGIPKSVPKTMGKSRDPDYDKVTMYLTKDLHKRLRTETLLADEDMSDLVERVMQEYFERKG